MHQVYLFVITAFLEVGTGLSLLFLPRIPLSLLLGMEQAAPDTIFVSRVAGAALLAIGIASWLARHDARSPAQIGILTAILFYDAAAAVLLVYAGAILNKDGIALWPAAVVHLFLAGWCGVSLLPR